MELTEGISSGKYAQIEDDYDETFESLALNKLFQNELALYRQLESKQYFFCQKYGWDIERAYRSIDKQERGQIAYNEYSLGCASLRFWLLCPSV